MFIGLTGTPGTGKTTIAAILQNKGILVLSINDIAFSQGFTLGKDEKHDTQLIDMDAINSFLSKEHTSHDLVFVEGHSAHLLDCIEKIIILRCHPTVLQQRLKTKHWSQEKTQENVEAEALDIILSETTEHFKNRDIFEIDTTDKTPEKICTCIKEIIDHGFTSINTYTIGQIDWLEDYLNQQKK